MAKAKAEQASTRRDPHPIRDFFISELFDYAPKDSADLMERPFFSLSKRPRKAPIEYKSPDGSLWIKVTAHPEYGMATIWDADILIWCVSQIMAARERGQNDFGRTIYTTPYELLKGIARDTGGRDYRELMSAIKRLRSTDVETNIRGGRRRYAAFHYLEQIDGEGEEADDPLRLKTLALTLPKWIFDGIMSSHVLTLDREYFLLKGGLERAIYRIARKHAGMQQQGWLCKMETLYAKTGSDSPFRKFSYFVREIARRNDLPGYSMTLTEAADGSAAVHFQSRSVTASHEVRGVAATRQRRIEDEARTLWIDQGRDPKLFATAWREWIESGHSPESFIVTHREAFAFTRQWR